MTRSAPAKWLLCVAGVLALLLAAVGIFLPLLPTTPFLLLAAACFARGSSRLHAWLLNHPWFGAYIRDYRERHGMVLPAKLVVLALLWGVIGFSSVAVVRSWWQRGILCAVAIEVTLHLVCLRTLPASKPDDEDPMAASP